MSNVINFTGTTTGDVPVDNVVQGAAEADLDMVVVVGWTKDDEMYVASSTGDLPVVEHLLNRVLLRSIAGGFAAAD